MFVIDGLETKVICYVMFVFDSTFIKCPLANDLFVPWSSIYSFEFVPRIYGEPGYIYIIAPRSIKIYFDFNVCLLILLV